MGIMLINRHSIKIRSSVFCLAFLFIILPFATIAQARKHKFPLSIIQISDPQFGFIENNLSFQKETDLYEMAVRAVNKILPDMVVITGDFVNDRSDYSQWNEFKRITAGIDSSIIVRLVPGNHDIGQVPVKADIEKYISGHGCDRFSILIEKCLFVGINSPIIKSGVKDLEQSQFEWLKGELERNRKARHKVIFSHYPFFIMSSDEPETYSNIGNELRTKYLDLFNEFEVDAVFSGHLHNNGGTSNGKTKMVVTSAVGKPLGEVPSGLRIIRINRKQVESEYYPLNKLPLFIP